MSRINLVIFVFFWILGFYVVLLGHRELDWVGYFIFFLGAPMFLVQVYGTKLIKGNW